ncbi:MAG: radical SAM protein [Myxococcaceae bacterium]
MEPPRHLLLQWHLTERCNLRCTHCYQSGERVPELGFGQLLELLGQFTDLLRGWRARTLTGRPRGHVTVTGGEPFVRADFLPLLEELASRRDELTFAVLTNGTLIDATLATRLAALRPSFVQVSIEGTAATHDAIRGRGSYQRAVEALGLLVEAKVRTQISFTAQAGNYREFPEVARLGRKLGVARVWADRLIPAGEGRGLSALSLSPQQTRELFELMWAARRAAKQKWFGRTEVSMRRALQFLVGGGRPYHCTAGDTLLTVLPNGDLVPCRRMPIVLGNLTRTPLRQLYEEHPLLQALRDRTKVSAGCEKCSLAPSCRGGLRCLSFAQTGDPFRADPGCWLAGVPPKKSAGLPSERPCSSPASPAGDSLSRFGGA